MNFIKNHYWGLLSIITTIFIAVSLYAIANPSALKPYQLALVSNDANISSLPHAWESKLETSVGSNAKQKHPGQSKAFTFVVLIESLDTERLALYIPYYQHHLTLFINGQPVDDLGFFREYEGDNIRSSTYLLLQNSWFKEGENTISVTVSVDDFFSGSLSNVYLGPAKVLTSRYQFQQFVTQDFKLLSFGAQFLFILTSLIRFYGRPQDTSALWLALFYTLSCVIGIHVFVDRLPVITPLIPWMFLLLPIAVSCLLAFRQAFQNNPPYKYMKSVVAAYISALLVCNVFFDVSLHGLLYFLSIPLACILISYVLFLYAKDIWITDNFCNAFMLTAAALFLLVLFLIGFRKYLGIDFDIYFIIVFKTLFLVGLAVLLEQKQTNDANLVDQAAAELANQLALKTQELEASFVQQRALAEKAARAKERQRITADLHDGVAGHLTTMLALIEIGDATNENLNEIANTALTDLRMVIETLALPEGDLRGALAAFRERCVAPLHYLGVDIEWDLIGLPRIEHLNSEQLLSILRLVQEAITNAMKHGQAKRFVISGWQPDTVTGCISITNSGGLPLQDYTPGHGIKSMHKRAAGIGGTLDIVKTYSGAIVNLRIPILR